MKEYAKEFYKGKQWKKISRLYMEGRNYVCERCGGVGSICHHKTYLTPRNINKPEVALNFGNLECLCQDCHNKEHMLKHSIAVFDSDGNVTGAKESREIEEYKQAVMDISAKLFNISDLDAGKGQQ